MEKQIPEEVGLLPLPGPGALGGREPLRELAGSVLPC